MAAVHEATRTRPTPTQKNRLLRDMAMGGFAPETSLEAGEGVHLLTGVRGVGALGMAVHEVAVGPARLEFLPGGFQGLGEAEEKAVLGNARGLIRDQGLVDN